MVIGHLSLILSEAKNSKGVINLGAKIKLQRKGTKNRPFYRVVVQDESAATKATIIEILGTYDTSKEPSLFQVNEEKTKDWLAKGAQPTEKVRILLGKAGIMEPVDLPGLHQKKSKKEQKADAESAKAAAAAEKSAAKEAPKAEEKPAEEKKEEPKAEEAPKVEEKPKEEAKEEPKAEVAKPAPDSKEA